jgi:hypothetical protein
MMQSISISSIAIYIKDFISIAELNEVKKDKTFFAKINQNSIELPNDLDFVDHVYLCGVDDLPDRFFRDSQLTYTHDDTVADQKGLQGFLGYTRRGNRLFFDITYEGEYVAEVHYKAMQVDEYGFPTLYYDGSLIQSVTNYIKFRYYDILFENNKVSYSLVQKAESEYLWYLGQFKNKNVFENIEDAEGVANSVQRFTRKKGRSEKGGQYPETNNF